jgi:N6-adenosine-specific RNA methylase IME4
VTTLRGYPVHPAADLFPMMVDAELQELAADIRANGQRLPIVLHEGKVLDGRNRLEACGIAGVEPRLSEWEGRGGSPVAFVASVNLMRRHLNESQRALFAAELLPFFEAEAKARQRAAGGDRRSEEARTALRPGADTDPAPRKPVAAAAQAAATANVGARTVERAKSVLAKAPELADKIRNGDVTLKQAEKTLRRGEQLEKVRAYVPPTGRFSVIVCDPPWSYEKRPEDETSRGQTDYPTMTRGEIAGLDVPAADDCILWLWTTNAHLLDGSAHQVLGGWGFEPKTMLTWVKDRMGVGDWLRGQTEHCILAVKGKPVVQLTNQTTVLHAPRREHSRKPDEFYALVEQLCPAPMKLEMFSRTRRAGWVCAGAEVDEFEAEPAADRDIKPANGRELVRGMLQAGDVVVVRWDPTTSKRAKFVRWVKGADRLVVNVEKVDAKGKRLGYLGMWGSERTFDWDDVLEVERP